MCRRPSGTSFVLIVGWSAGTQVRPAGEGTPYSPTPVVGRHHLDLDAGLAVQPRNVATQTEGSIIYALGHVLREEITIRNPASWTVDGGRPGDAVAPLRP